MARLVIGPTSPLEVRPLDIDLPGRLLITSIDTGLQPNCARSNFETVHSSSISEEGTKNAIALGVIPHVFGARAAAWASGLCFEICFVAILILRCKDIWAEMHPKLFSRIVLASSFTHVQRCEGATTASDWQQ